MTRPDRASPEEEQQSALRAAFELADLSLEQLWLRYFALGGSADLMEVDAHLSGLMGFPATERDMLAHAVNERLDELMAQRRAPYSRAIRLGAPSTGPLAALVGMLGAAGAAPPERLPSLAAAAGRTLGVEVAVHLIDHEQRSLVRLPTAYASTPERLGLDSTMAGRAFRTVQILSSDRAGVPRLWVPVLDGADRLGVLEVGLAAPGDLYDPALRQQCSWLASMLGHLIASMNTYGDELERPRRNQPLSPSAELIWQQLPPLTAATDAFVLAGMLEPSYDVGGDAFDYALSERRSRWASSTRWGTASAPRSWPRPRWPATAAPDGTPAGSSTSPGSSTTSSLLLPSSAFVTGVLAELDVESGRLRYVNAGHPPPLLLREGRWSRNWPGDGGCPSARDRGPDVGEEVLEPGDWLALYTDGITEARDAAGAWFGEARLVDFLTRAIAPGSHRRRRCGGSPRRS
jgi:hypothetical protein